MDESLSTAAEEDPLPPLPVRSAARAVLRCVGAAAVLFVPVPHPPPAPESGSAYALCRRHRGRCLPGTIADGVVAFDPCTLLVTFPLAGHQGLGISL